MSVLQRLEPRSLFPDLFEWFEAAFAVLREAAGQPIRVEDYTHDGTYVIRAELPDVDPDKDVEITVTGGLFRIHAERREERKEAHRSEFRYGEFSRLLRLPDDVKAEDIKASYDKGILTVTVPVPQAAKAEAEAKHIPIETSHQA